MAWIDRALLTTTWFFPQPMRLLMVKDLRIFRRDPMQWSQFLIFFGLLALYFFNVRRFNYDLYYIGWVNMVSFLNLSVVGLLMSTFTTRFIYPMLSLEGQTVLAAGTAAGPPGNDSLEQVSLCRGHRDSALLDIDSA